MSIQSLQLITSEGLAQIDLGAEMNCLPAELHGAENIGLDIVDEKRFEGIDAAVAAAEEGLGEDDVGPGFGLEPGASLSFRAR